ncbi:hypothetical protein DRI96_02810 [Candidatus Aerophobetes bacterium]|uniref:Uncharacterized protein n=1 Tax=Aerophobetes bacterium TaxID=2030807 RepID=A0A662DI01_UNCAE|nr:MAG: hypothetical protein DRI96_02810 [Candidatus Aerophobetes bacterium]
MHLVEIGTLLIKLLILKGSWVSQRKPSFWRAEKLALHQSTAQPKSGRPSCSKVRGDTKL